MAAHCTSECYSYPFCLSSACLSHDEPRNTHALPAPPPPPPHRSYLPIQKWDLPSIIRRAGFAAFGVYGTELNPGFVEGVAAVAGKGACWVGFAGSQAGAVGVDGSSY